jgi:hypothetical protein
MVVHILRVFGLFNVKPILEKGYGQDKQALNIYRQKMAEK